MERCPSCRRIDGLREVSRAKLCLGKLWMRLRQRSNLLDKVGLVRDYTRRAQVTLLQEFR